MNPLKRLGFVLGIALLVVGVMGLAAGRASAHPHPDQDRAWLGVGLTDGDDGVRVARVYDDSPAAEAGLGEGDTIVAVDGDAVDSPADLIEAMKGYQPGDTVSLRVRSEDGDTRTLTATLDTWPEGQLMIGSLLRGFEMPEIEIPEIHIPELNLENLEGLEGLESLKGLKGFPIIIGGAKTYMGVELHGPSDQLRDVLGAGPGEGVLIDRVVEDTPAEEAGLRAGDLIVSVDGQEVSESSDITAAIREKEPGDTVTVEVIRDRNRRELSVTLTENPNHWEQKIEIRQKGDLSNEQREAIREAVAQAREAAAAARAQWAEALRQNREVWRKALENARENHRRVIVPFNNEIRDLIRRNLRRPPPGEHEGEVLHV